MYLWDDRIGDSSIERGKKERALQVLRRFGWRYFYLRYLRQDCFSYMVEEYGSDWTTKPRTEGGKPTQLGRDQHSITQMLWHAGQTDWFEYHAGSRLKHFRFPRYYRKLAQDGVPVYFETPGPSTKEAQPPISDPGRRAKVREKLEKVLRRRYMLHAGLPLKSLIKYFDVPKGEHDIRIVYDATANKLNECVWVPSFWLPTLNTLVRALDVGSWMTDRDVADMFLNYQLCRSVVPFTGIDLTPMYEKGEKVEPKWAYWDRNLMGFAASPFNSVKMALIVEEMVRGNRLDIAVDASGKESNPFQWKAIKLNLPGSPNFDPTFSWVVKLREDGNIACDVFTFMDDERVVGPTRELTWQASHRLACIQAYVGVQDAARKVRPCDQTNGAWAGAVVHIIEGLGVCTLTSEEKWTKLKHILDKWWSRVSSATGQVMLDHKELLSDRGFLIYVTRTYPSMIPYLKGFHLSIEMWRGGRDAEGWKLRGGDDSSVDSDTTLDALDATRAGAHGVDLGGAATYDPAKHEDEDAAAMDHRMERRAGAQRLYAPADGLTPAVPRLRDDLAALRELADFDLPPLRVVRPTTVVQVFYGFGDASGKQFGATLSQDYNCQGRLGKPRKGADGVRYRLGVWSADERKESSNYKELHNLVDTIESEARLGHLRNCILFIFTDNSTAESCFFRGSSSSPHLHADVLRLRKLEMEYAIACLLIHVSGKRMIAQGTDGLSRGSLMEGVMAGHDMLYFVDLSRTAIERHPPLLQWIREWTGQEALEPLTPEGWFEEGHGIVGGALDRRGVWIPHHGPGRKMFLWAPQPAAAEAAFEELLKARQKRTDTFHVVVVPRLMAPLWRRLFNKVCDFTFEVSPAPSFWPESMFEPLWVGIVLPFTHHRPWCLKRAPLLVELGGKLRGMLPTREADAGALLRELLLLPRRLSAVSASMARGMLHMPREGGLPNAQGH